MMEMREKFQKLAKKCAQIASEAARVNDTYHDEVAGPIAAVMLNHCLLKGIRPEDLEEEK